MSTSWLHVSAETASHHSAVGSGPLSSPHHPECAVSEPLEQLQLRLSDQAGERGGSVATGWCRAGRRTLREGLLGVGVRSFHRKHLQEQKKCLELRC